MYRTHRCKKIEALLHSMAKQKVQHTKTLRIGEKSCVYEGFGLGAKISVSTQCHYGCNYLGGGGDRDWTFMGLDILIIKLSPDHESHLAIRDLECVKTRPWYFSGFNYTQQRAY